MLQMIMIMIMMMMMMLLRLLLLLLLLLLLVKTIAAGAEYSGGRSLFPHRNKIEE